MYANINAIRYNLKAIQRMAGLPLVLQEGSPTYGRAFRLFVEEEHGALGHVPAIVPMLEELDAYGFIGHTKKEAMEFLERLYWALEANR